MIYQNTETENTRNEFSKAISELKPGESFRKSNYKELWCLCLRSIPVFANVSSFLYNSKCKGQMHRKGLSRKIPQCKVRNTDLAVGKS